MVVQLPRAALSSASRTASAGPHPSTTSNAVFVLLFLLQFQLLFPSLMVVVEQIKTQKV